MVKENARIGLNEIGFGSSLFAGSMELLRFCVGDRRAQEAVYGGALYTAEQALGLGLIDAAVPEDALVHEARGRLEQLAGRSPDAFRSIKRLLRRPVLEEMQRGEDASIQEFVDIWYSEATRAELEKIKDPFLTRASAARRGVKASRRTREGAREACRVVPERRMTRARHHVNLRASHPCLCRSTTAGLTIASSAPWVISIGLRILGSRSSLSRARERSAWRTCGATDTL